ncbi:MAG: sporulation transcriptional regulator SpoIIID [Eubacteriales bacterium]
MDTGFDFRHRCEILADYMINTRATVRAAAAQYGVSKSTVYCDVTERLSHLNPALAAAVKEVLDENKAQRHIRGGEATRLKYHMAKN